MEFDYRNIRDEDHFENLVADYFRELAESSDNNIVSVDAKQTGIGTDGGRDILIELMFSDEVVTFKRKWVVQCKFRENNISPTEISSVNIPTLIHSYNADGYLLVCKKNPTSGTTGMFERLNDNCTGEYEYQVWNGDQFLRMCRVLENLHAMYFSEYHEWILNKRDK